MSDKEVLGHNLIPKHSYIVAKALRMELGADPMACYSILLENGLHQYFNDITTKNPSHDLPYHNATHIAAVVTLCYEGAHYLNLTYYSLRTLLIAASLHDYGHSGGLRTDSENINIAVNKVHSHKEDAVRFKEVENIIRCTEFPYVLNPVTDSENIMRDADLMMPYLERETRLRLFKGLKQETKFQGSWKEFASKVSKFYSKVTWHTIWGQKRSEVYNFDACVNQLCLDLEKLDGLH